MRNATGVGSFENVASRLAIDEEESLKLSIKRKGVEDRGREASALGESPERFQDEAVETLCLIHGKDDEITLSASVEVDVEAGFPCRISSGVVAARTVEAKGKPLIAPVRDMGSPSPCPGAVEGGHDCERAALDRIGFGDANDSSLLPKRRKDPSVGFVKKEGEASE